MGAQITRLAQTQEGLPGWMPEDIRHYLLHTEGGRSIRALAREEGCHPSTILRQVRRCETLRDDPLTDAALTRLGQLVLPEEGEGAGPRYPAELGDAEGLDRETLRALRALAEPGCELVVADGVEDAVVVKTAGRDRPLRRLVVSRALAEVLALRGHIAGAAQGRVARYRISPAGRGALGRLMAQAESRKAAGFYEAQEGFAPRPLLSTGQRARPVERRLVAVEPPLHQLARRRDRRGRPFLPRDLVEAGERLREDFELSGLAPVLRESWEAVIAGRLEGLTGLGADEAEARRGAARGRLGAALGELGPDLSEVLILCCCEHQGMEVIEKRMALTARSGKIVLRIALRSLARHYAARGGAELIY